MQRISPKGFPAAHKIFMPSWQHNAPRVSPVTAPMPCAPASAISTSRTLCFTATTFPRLNFDFEECRAQAWSMDRDAEQGGGRVFHGARHAHVAESPGTPCALSAEMEMQTAAVKSAVPTLHDAASTFFRCGRGTLASKSEQVRSRCRCGSVPGQPATRHGDSPPDGGDREDNGHKNNFAGNVSRPLHGASLPGAGTPDEGKVPEISEFPKCG